MNVLLLQGCTGQTGVLPRIFVGLVVLLGVNKPLGSSENKKRWEDMWPMIVIFVLE